MRASSWPGTRHTRRKTPVLLARNVKRAVPPDPSPTSGCGVAAPRNAGFVEPAP